jgi:hypothetical protein
MLLPVIALIPFSYAYVSLDLLFSTEQAGVPSRAMVTSLRIGEPEQRFLLMLDFNHSHIEINSCLPKDSRFFDDEQGSTDKVAFEEDGFDDVRGRGIFRMRVQPHCTSEDRLIHERFERNCVFPDRCQGVLGLGRHSPLWEVWQAYTLTLHALHLGHDNFFFKGDDDDDDAGHHDDKRRNLLRCSQSRTERICEFEATLGGIDVLVDFHTDDAYIWVPQHIYALYMAERSLDDVVGAELLFDTKDLEWRMAERRRHNDTVRVDPDDDDDDRAHPLHHHEVRLFREALEHSRKFAGDYSPYFRNSIEHEWYPLVFEPRGRNKGGAVLVVDRDLLVYSPALASSFGGIERSASENIFGSRLVSQETRLLLRPHNWDDNRRVSIGNGILKRYVLHRDLRRHTLLFELRITNEHLTAFETLLATILFTYFVRSLCYSIELMTPLAMCMQRACFACGHTEDAQTYHRRILSHSIYEGLIYVLTIALPFFLALHVRIFFDNVRAAPWLFAYVWTTIGVDGFVLSFCIFYSANAHHMKRPPAGAYCWRSFRVASSRYSASEHLLLLGTLLILLVIRRDALSNVAAALIGLLMVGNGVRHFYHSFRAGLSMRRARTMLANASSGKKSSKAAAASDRRDDLPSWGSNFLWLSILFIEQFSMNLVATTAFVWRFILWPLILSHWLVALLLSLTAVVGLSVVDRYTDRELQDRAKFSSTPSSLPAKAE